MKTTTPQPVFALLITWFLLLPMLFFVARGTFSFDRFQYFNNRMGDIGALTPSGADTTYYRVERFLMYGIVIVAVATLFKTTFRALKRNWGVIVLPLLAAASTFWSQDRTRTFVFSFLAICLTFFAVFLVQRFPGKKILYFFTFVGLHAAFVSYFLIACAPSIAIRQYDGSGAWIGIFAHKNHLANNMTYLLTAALYVRSGTTLTRVALYGYCLAVISLVAMSQARTGWITLLLLLLYIGLMRLYLISGAKDRLFTVVAVAVAAAVIAYLVVTFAPDLSVALGKSRDMTGRTRIWAAIVPELLKRPILGWGYQAFWLTGKGESASFDLLSGLKGLTNAENGLFQSWLELGAVGAGFILILMFHAMRNALVCLRADSPQHIQWSSAIVFLTFIGLLSGVKVMYPDTIEWVMFVVAYVALADQARLLRRMKTEMNHSKSGSRQRPTAASSAR